MDQDLNQAEQFTLNGFSLSAMTVFCNYRNMIFNPLNQIIKTVINDTFMTFIRLSILVGCPKYCINNTFQDFLWRMGFQVRLQVDPHLGNDLHTTIVEDLEMIALKLSPEEFENLVEKLPEETIQWTITGFTSVLGR